jgi:phosphoribosylaminoimidazole carboxylase (NCAIR synthetase)
MAQIDRFIRINSDRIDWYQKTKSPTITLLNPSKIVTVTIRPTNPRDPQSIQGIIEMENGITYEVENKDLAFFLAELSYDWIFAKKRNTFQVSRDRRRQKHRR